MKAKLGRIVLIAALTIERSNGRVGIGTTDPQDGKLSIANSATDEAYISLNPGPGALNDIMGIRVSESGNNTTKMHFGREFTVENAFVDFVTIDSVGRVGIGTTNPGAKLHVNGDLRVTNLPFGDKRNCQWDNVTGQFFFDNSSRRYKENITSLEDDFSALLKIEPKTYTRPGDPNRWEIGYIAEDFHEMGLAKLVDYDTEGRPDGINYEKICLYLTEIVNPTSTNRS